MSNRGRSFPSLLVLAALGAAAGLLVAGIAAAGDAKSAKKAVISPVGFEDAELRGDLPAGAPFIEPDSLLEGKSNPRGKVLFSGEELVVEVYADDDYKLRVDEPFAHDEFIYILSGNLVLTDTAGVEQKYAKGDMLMIPKGFRGTWHQSEDFRELVVIERKVYDATYSEE